MKSDKQFAIGVDIGGSHVSCAAYDLFNNEYISYSHAESELDNHGSADEIMDVWSATIHRSLEAIGRDKLLGIGFAMPGPFDYLKGISRFKGENDKFENTYGLDVPAELKRLIDLPDDTPVRFINDATAFAIGEDRFGVASDASRSLSITLGTGFGSAFIRDHLPVLIGNDVPEQGCLWHLPYEDGIADDYFSTRGFLKRYRQISGKMVSGVKELAGMADDKSVKYLFEDFGYRLGTFLKPWVSSSGSAVLVLGGNISGAYSLFGEGLDKGLEGSGAAVNVSELKETASIIGSAYLADNEFYNKLLPLLAIM
jgi:glucokinase